MILAFCLNDVVNPRLHWAYTGRGSLEIPDEALPNLNLDRYVARPVMHSSLARFVHGLLRRTLRLRDPPVFLTGEDAISIHTLMDDASAEWRWLRSLLLDFKRVVESSGAEFMLLILPLSYPLDADYPFVPQEVFLRFCQRKPSIAWTSFPPSGIAPTRASFSMRSPGPTCGT